MTVQWRRAVRLGRALSRAAFERETLPPGLPQIQSLIWSVTALMAPGLGVIFLFTPRYARLSVSGGIDSAVAGDRVLLVALTMIAMGLAALLLWEATVPSRRDALILSPLPLSRATFVVARLGVAGLVFSLCLVAVLLPVVWFAITASRYVGVPGVTVSIAAHTVAVTAAGVFVYWLLLMLQCAAFLTLGPRAARRLALALQIVFTIGLTQVVMLLPIVGRSLASRAVGVDWLESPATPWFPPLWFVAVYEALAGTTSAVVDRYARLGVAAAGVCVLAAVTLYGGGYTRMVRLAIETSPPPPGGVARTVRRTAASIEDWLLRSRSPVERAVCAFTLTVLARSRGHGTRLAVYVAVAVALVLSALLPMFGRPERLLQPNVAVASAPLVLLFCTLVGLRAVAAMSIEPRASWALRVREPADRLAVVNGLRTAMMLAATLVLAIALPALALLWGIGMSLAHVVFCALMALLLAEILLVGFCQIPCAATSFPKQRFTRWPVYFLGFTLFTYTATLIELALLRWPLRFVALCGLVAVAIAALARWRARELSAATGLTFVGEDTDALFEGFHFSESEAASRPPAAVRLKADTTRAGRRSGIQVN